MVWFILCLLEFWLIFNRLSVHHYVLIGCQFVHQERNHDWHVFRYLGVFIHKSQFKSMLVAPSIKLVLQADTCRMVRTRANLAHEDVKTRYIWEDIDRFKVSLTLRLLLYSFLELILELLLHVLSPSSHFTLHRQDSTLIFRASDIFYCCLFKVLKYLRFVNISENFFAAILVVSPKIHMICN